MPEVPRVRVERDCVIVKVQIPLASSEPYDMARALVYDRSRDYYNLIPVTPKLLSWMNGTKKRFFHAHLNGDELVIDFMAEWQDW